jgi:hypothetical protein
VPPWLKSIDEQGFAIIPDVLTESEVKYLLANVARVSQRRTKAGARHLLGCPPVAMLAQEPRLIEIARAVLGSDAFPFRSTLFDKSPDANWLVVWHQDQALPLRERREMRGLGALVSQGRHTLCQRTSARITAGSGLARSP